MTNLLCRINDVLCMDVRGEIFTFIPSFVRKQLSKQLYLENTSHIPQKNSFIRQIVRKDFGFIFQYHLEKNYTSWHKLRNWIYKNMVFYNYIEYIRYLCNEYQSGRCKNIMNILEKKIKPKEKKKYKRVRIRNTRWNN